jgi:osmotically-inducible protein OsmY
MWTLLRFGTRTSYRTVRRIGLGRIVVFAAGAGVGLLVAPTSGAELRERLRRRWEDLGERSGDLEIAQRVRDELAQSPRTWHLPQPEVEVAEGTAILTGLVPHVTGRADLERTAAAVAGVVDVDSRLIVESK